MRVKWTNDNNNNNNNNNSSNNNVVSQKEQLQLQQLQRRLCIYALQGISDGEHVLFYYNNDNSSKKLQENDDYIATTTTTSIQYHHYDKLEEVVYKSSTNNPNNKVQEQDIEQQQQQQQYQQKLDDAILLCAGTMGIYIRYVQTFIYMNDNTDLNRQQQQQQQHHQQYIASSIILRNIRYTIQEEIQSYLLYINSLIEDHETETNNNNNSNNNNDLQQQQQQSIPKPFLSIQELLYRTVYHPYYSIQLKTLAIIVSIIRMNIIVSSSTSSSSQSYPQQEQDHQHDHCNNNNSSIGINVISHLYKLIQHRHCTTTTTTTTTTGTNIINNNVVVPSSLSLSSQSPMYTVITKVLQSSIQSWLYMIYHWVMYGTILYPNEYFITTTTTTTTTYNTRSATKNLWQHGYSILPNRIPQIGMKLWRDENNSTSCNSYTNNDHICSNTTTSLIDMIYQIGKGMNYIHVCLHHTTYSLVSQLLLTNDEVGNMDTTIDDEEKQNNKTSSNIITNTDTMYIEQLGFTYESIVQEQQYQKQGSWWSCSISKLRTTLEQSVQLVHDYIVHCITNELHLLQHLYCIKQFLLFGQYDFYMIFIDMISIEFPNSSSTIQQQQQSKRSTTITNNNNNAYNSSYYRHTFINILDASIKSTVTRNGINTFPNHILERLSIEFQNNNNDDDAKDTKTTIWDTLILTYTVPDPIVAIVHDDTIYLYQSMFQYLLQLHHIEYQLQTLWKSNTTIQRSLYKNAQYLGISISTNTSYQQAIKLLRYISIIHQKMMHYITTTKYYIMSDVIEYQWNQLIHTNMKHVRTLDDVIRIHDTYINNIARQSLLYNSNNNKNKTPTFTTTKYISIGQQVRTLFDSVQQFCTLQEELFVSTIQAMDRAIDKRRTAEQSMKQGTWGFQTEREALEQETFFGLSDESKVTLFDECSNQYETDMITFLNTLDVFINGGLTVSIENNNTGTISTPNTSISSIDLNNVKNDVQVDDVEIDSLRYYASQLNQNFYYGVTNF